MSHTLLIDMGNQRLKWAMLDISPGQSVGELLSGLEKHNGIVDIADSADSMFQQSRFEEVVQHAVTPARVFVSCVSAQQAWEELDQLSFDSWQIRPVRVNSEATRIGLANKYSDPTQLGSDRWLAALAGYQLVCKERNKQAVIVVDAGTAVTVDLVDAHQFKGGSILPGVDMMIKALGNSTGMIDIDIPTLSQHVEALRYPDVVAVNSDAAVQAGALASVAGGVERCLRQMHQICGGSVDVLITGGDAKLVNSMIDYPCEIVPRLVLAGLALIAMGELE